MLFDKFVITTRQLRQARLIGLVLLTAVLSACQFQPMLAPSTSLNNQLSPGQSDVLAGDLSQVGVREVNTRVGQQVRNHLLFLFQGGSGITDSLYEARLQVTSFVQKTSAQASERDTTAGFVSVTTSYALIDLATGKRVSGGTRTASAAFDRTTQIFANQRAIRDAENRAGRSAAEQIRLAIAADLRR